MKVCTGCRAAKDLDAFGPDRRNNDGRKARCRQCLAVAARPADRQRDYRAERQRRGNRSIARSALASAIHHLYRLWDESGVLLYVGITSNPANRLQVHRSLSPWWNDVRHWRFQEYPDRIAALDAEREAILSEKPLHNKQGAVGTAA